MRCLLLCGALALPADLSAQPYVGTFGGAVVLDRSIPGNADQGGDAFLVGVRTGFTMNPVWRLQVGAEAEAWTGGLQSSSGGLGYRFNADGGFGAYTIIGARFDAGAMPFVRLGVSALYPEMRGRPSIGLGLLAPVSDRLSVRADISLSHADTQVWTGSLGVQWRF